MRKTEKSDELFKEYTSPQPVVPEPTPVVPEPNSDVPEPPPVVPESEPDTFEVVEEPSEVGSPEEVVKEVE